MGAFARRFDHNWSCLNKQASLLPGDVICTAISLVISFESESPSFSRTLVQEEVGNVLVFLGFQRGLNQWITSGLTSVKVLC